MSCGNCCDGLGVGFSSGGGITEITSLDGSVTITNPTGPVVDLSVAVTPAVPGGLNGAIQFNDAGSFGGRNWFTLNDAGRQIAFDGGNVAGSGPIVSGFNQATFVGSAITGANWNSSNWTSVSWNAIPGVGTWAVSQFGSYSWSGPGAGVGADWTASALENLTWEAEPGAAGVVTHRDFIGWDYQAAGGPISWLGGSSWSSTVTGNHAISAGANFLAQAAADATVQSTGATARLAGVGSTVEAGADLVLNGGTDALIWPATDGTAGQILTTDGAGNLSWAASAGGSPSVGSAKLNQSNGAGGWSDTQWSVAGGGYALVSAAGGAGQIQSTNGLVVRGGTGALLDTVSGPVLIAPAGDLQLQASGGDVMSWPIADGSSGDVLTTDGAGGMSWQPAGGAGADGAQTMSLADVSGTLTVWAGAGGGFGNAYLVALFVEHTTEPLQNLVALVTQAPGGAGGIGAAIYDSTGARLATTAITPPALGVNTIPLATGIGTVLAGGTLYYLGVYSNQNGAVLAQAQGTPSVPAGVPPLGFQVPNSGSIGGAVNGWPASVAAFFGTQVVNRPWIGARA